ncbi:MAG: hypothetical protein RR293_01775 [Bacteroidales bacterium]
MNKTLFFPLVVILLLLFACSDEHKEAHNAYLSAVKLYETGNYAEAKMAIDSVKILDPKAFNEIRAGMQLSRKVELAINKNIIKRIDSLMPMYKTELKRLLEGFDYVKDKKYQTEGILVYKNNPNKLSQSTSCLRIQVSEKGEMQLLSVYYGTYQLEHEAVKVSLSNGTYAMTNAIPHDRANNYRYKLNGNNIETVTYRELQMRPIADFIVAAGDKPIKVSYEGKRPFTYSLDKTTRKAILESYKLATLIKDIKSLEREDDITSRTIVILNRQINEHRKDSI